MNSIVTDIRARLIEKAESAARSGAYDLDKHIVALRARMDEGVIAQSIRWCAQDDDRLKRLGIEVLREWDEVSRSEQEILVCLMWSDDAEVRSWSTFFLAQSDTDDEITREALHSRLTDDHDETRGEALVGLARRRDNRVVQVLKEEFCSGDVGTLAVEAAREIASQDLVPELLELRGWWDVDDDLLSAAIEACTKAP